MAAKVVQAVVDATLAASPRADASALAGEKLSYGFLARMVDGMNVWTVILTLLLTAVLYDQC